MTEQSRTREGKRKFNLELTESLVLSSIFIWEVLPEYLYLLDDFSFRAVNGEGSELQSLLSVPPTKSKGP